MKLRNTFLLMLTVLVVLGGAGIIWTVNSEMRQQALTEAEAKARILLDRNLSAHTYFTHQLKPALFELSKNRAEPGYFDPVWMSSTYAVREMQKYFQSLNPNDYYYKECAINARSPKNEADSHERRFLEKLNRNPDLTAGSGIREIDGEPYFYVLRRGETMESSCLRCHSTPEAAPDDMVAEYGPERSFGRNIDEVVSAVSIRIPLDKAFANANRLSLFLSGQLLLILLAILGIILWFNREYLFLPIDRIREKSRQIAESETQPGETIELPKGRELRDLTESFNDMSRKLGRQMSELEDRVRQRTAELTEKNAELEKAITEQKKTAYLLEQSEHKHRTILESMPDAVYICAPDYTISYMNQAMMRRTGRDATGEPCYSAIHGLNRKCDWCRYGTVAEGKHARHEVESPADKRIFNITHAPIFNPDGTVSNLSIYRDMTEHRKMEQALFDARKLDALGGMAGGIAHDFNNLMSVVLGYISMLKDEAISESSRDMLSNAENACIQTKHLTRRLIMLTRSEEPVKKRERIEHTVRSALETGLHEVPSVQLKLD
ncbi:MAG: c-type heme family protein, partial [Desulfosalsimonas sp.]